MTGPATPALTASPVTVIGAGIGGLAAAARLAQAGQAVQVFERHSCPGGKMRTLPSVAGPVDTGPTVLTMRPVFEALFADLGERLEDHVTLTRQPLIARHFWAGGAVLDLYDDAAASAREIATFSSARNARQFLAFHKRARRLFEGFDDLMIRAARPSPARLALRVAARPYLMPAMAPLASLARMLDGAFDDPRLAQLFGRYSTYVGGSPYLSPALLGLIWHAESAGVWSVQGGLHRLAKALAAIAEARGAVFHYDTAVEEIETGPEGVTGLRLSCGARLATRTLVFNGDPRALALGRLGEGPRPAAPQAARAPRSLSAEVWAFGAQVMGPDLAHHNVFFRTGPKPEFDALARGTHVGDPTLYLCAMDRGPGAHPPSERPERFEIIANAAPLTLAHARTPEQEIAQCRTRSFATLSRFGLRFDPPPADSSLTTPWGFERLFPGSAGALYGQSPHGMMAALSRPRARTKIPGLYLAGGGVHPGAGVPMATLSGLHAAAAIMSDRPSTSTSRRTATPGGMSTGSAPAGAAPSASSRS